MYAHTVELDLPIDQAIEKLKAVLTDAKMGVVSEVNVQAIMKAKLDHDMPPYRLLGICAAGIARRVLEADRDAGALLPCGCCAYEVAPGRTRFALQDPAGIATLSGNADIAAIMAEAQTHLAGVLATLRG